MVEAKTATDRELEARWQKVEQRILAVSHLLHSQGNINCKEDCNGDVWRLRFYERLPGETQVQRTIRIGSHPILLAKARALLQRCRNQQRSLAEIPVLARLVAGIDLPAVRKRRRGITARRKMGIKRTDGRLQWTSAPGNGTGPLGALF